MSRARTHLGDGVYVEYHDNDDGFSIWKADEPAEGVRMGDAGAAHQVWISPEVLARLRNWIREHLG